MGFFGGFFGWIFLGGFFVANPAFSRSRSRDLERPPLPPRRRSRDRDRERDLSRRFFDFLERLPERERLPPRRRSLGERERRRSFLWRRLELRSSSIMIMSSSDSPAACSPIYRYDEHFRYRTDQTIEGGCATLWRICRILQFLEIYSWEA